MSFLRSALLYASLALGANAAFADASTIGALREGEMKKLVVHSAAKPAGTAEIFDENGGVHRLEEYRGKYVVLNFWATWCAPCRKEMPSLDVLNQELGGDNFAVVPVATGRNPLPSIQRFFKQAEVVSLPIMSDPKKALAVQMGAFGLPMTVILDREGNEIARMTGDADWASESAFSIIQALIADK